MPGPLTPTNQVRPDKKLVAIAFFATALIATWFFSRWTYDVYILGDLYHYRRFWQISQFLPFEQITMAQQNYTGSVEPLYGLFVWTFSAFGHDIVLSVVNTLFVAFFLLLLRSHGVPVVVLPLYLTNFYIIVLLGPAERLKFAVLFLMFALLTSGIRRASFFIAAPFLHLQTLLLLLPLGADIILPNAAGNSQATAPTRFLKAAAATIFLGAILLVMAESLFVKAAGYSEAGEGGAWQSFVALGIAAVFLREQRAFLLALSLNCIAALILGGSRVNMISVILLISMFIRARKFYHPALLVLLVYLSGKGLLFINTYWEHGDGWPQSY